MQGLDQFQAHFWGRLWVARVVKMVVGVVLECCLRIGLLILESVG